MLAQGKPDDAPRPHVQHAGQLQFAFGGVDLGAVTEPALVDPSRGEIPFDQVRGAPAAPARAGGAPPVMFRPGPRPLLGHQLRDGVLGDPPAHVA
jgi:hypothetical protein